MAARRNEKRPCHSRVYVVACWPFKNELMDNYICIGDIHGRFDLLANLMLKINEANELKGHKIVFLGDMVDRGPNSFDVVALVKSLCESGRAIALVGNHEMMMLDFYERGLPDKQHNWLWNGGQKTIKSYADSTYLYGIASFFKSFDESGHAAFIKSLPLYYETDKVFFSHAPIPIRPYRHKEEFRTDVDALTWSWHGHFGISEGEFAHDHGKLAACGHVHALRENILTPRVYDTIIYADTGSGCGPQGPLTAIVITDGKYVRYMQALPEGEKLVNTMDAK